MQTDPTVAAILQVASQLGIAVVFILAWLNERKERQAVQQQLIDTQKAHQAEMLTILNRMFEVLSGLHLTIPAPTTENGKITQN